MININNKVNTNTFWIMFGRMFQIILTFITTMLITRYLGPLNYGKITYAFSYVSLFIPIGQLGLNDIIIKQLINKRAKNNEILGTIIVLRTASSFFSVLLIYILFKNIIGSTELLHVAFLQSISLIFQTYECIIYFYQSKLLAKKVGIIYAIAYISTSLFRIICLVLNRNIYWFAFCTSLDYIVIAILLLFTYFKDGNKLIFSKQMVKELLFQSRPYLFSGILTVIAGKADSILLGNLIDEETVGYYNSAITLCNAWPFVLSAIIDSSSPIIISLYDSDRAAYRKRIRQLYAVIFYISLIVALIFTVFSNQIITFIYGNNYLKASVPLKIACWSTVFSYFGVARFIWMQCENKHYLERRITLFGLIFNLIMNFILIRSFGIIGAAITLTVTQFFMNFILLFFFKETRQNAIQIMYAIILKDV